MHKWTNDLSITKALAALIMLVGVFSPSVVSAETAGEAKKPVVDTKKVAAASDAECKTFVEKFYAFYLIPETKRKTQPNAPENDAVSDLARNRKFLPPKLYAALKADLDASMKAKGDLVGLDFDPFFNAQEVPDRFVSGKVTTKGANKMVEACGYWFGKKTPQLDAVLELQNDNSQWHIANVHYPADKDSKATDLLGILAGLKHDRDTNWGQGPKGGKKK
ncbi:MAG TPA: DUF3828 domain-containing protein [Planktothrix sp.]